jgi:hypothetical protein
MSHGFPMGYPWGMYPMDSFMYVFVCIFIYVGQPALAKYLARSLAKYLATKIDPAPPKIDPRLQKVCPGSSQVNK